MHYLIDNNLQPAKTADTVGLQLIILPNTTQAPSPLPEGLEPEELRASSHSRFCKAEAHGNYLLGTLCLPPKGAHQKGRSLVYSIWAEHLLFLDDDGYAEAIFEKISQKASWQNPGLGQVLHDFFTYLILDDLRYLERLEQQINALENQVLQGKLEHFNRHLIRHRREIMQLAHYYSQMADMVDELLQNENHFFSKKELRLFSLLKDRLLRLKEEAYLLREYALQIREVYQSQLDLRQNSIMQTLTIVTTIFLPLSLIAGWYGMNFVNMPELSWRYGYPTVSIISISVVIFCIWLFKKKKYW